MDEVSRSYQILGLQSPVSEDALKRAFRDLVKVWHPDRFAHDEKLQHMAQEKLKEINGAYEILLASLFDERATTADATPESPPPKTPGQTATAPAGKRTVLWVVLIIALVLLAAVWGVSRKKSATHASVPPAPQSPPSQPGRIIADHLFIVADDFIVDVFHNGNRVADQYRELKSEIFGATAEKITMTVREGDWLVFNVVNNRLRWGGVCYFGVAGLDSDGAIGFVSELQSGNWSCCDDPSRATQFIAESGYLATNQPHAIEHPWDRGNSMMEHAVRDWPGQPIWGTNRNTWIKFRAPRRIDSK